MKIAVVGSRDITVTNIGSYLSNAEEIVSGGALGVAVPRNMQEETA